MAIHNASQVICKEYFYDGTSQYFVGILIDENTLIALDNGEVLDPKSEWLKIVNYISWNNLSDDLLLENPI